MSWSLGFWIGAAVLLFWAVGAYNRLVRSRAAALQAFASLDTQLRQQAELVQQCLPATAASPMTQPGELLDDVAARWIGLGGAVAQFNATLSAARARPLEPEVIAALHAAQGVLYMGWQRLGQDDVYDLAGAALPDTLLANWQQLAGHVHAATVLFNQAIDNYNEAIAQFPALLLAWLFGFKRARAL